MKVEVRHFRNEVDAIEHRVRGDRGGSAEDERLMADSIIYRVQYRDRWGGIRYRCVTACSAREAAAKAMKHTDTAKVIAVSFNEYEKTSYVV
jgi:hypothetical protein